MAFTIELWEDSGALDVNGVPTVREKISNVNWKRISGSTNAYYINPLRLDDPSKPFVFSYKKYIYAKIIGTYSTIKRMRWSIAIDQDLGNPVDLYYDMTNVYTVPDDSQGAMTYVKDSTGCLLQSSYSLLGPQNATTHLDSVAANSTVYSDYLVTQTRFKNGTNHYGNSNVIMFNFIVDEYE